MLNKNELAAPRDDSKPVRGYVDMLCCILNMDHHDDVCDVRNDLNTSCFRTWMTRISSRQVDRILLKLVLVLFGKL